MEIRRMFGPAMAALSAVAVVLALAGTAAGLGTKGPQSYYLALGDSIAYGFDPGKGHRPSPSDTGYVDLFAAQLRKLSPKIAVVNYGCPGESSVTFARGGCPYLREGGTLHDPFRGSQLKAALAFLRAHRGKVSPITLTLWGNDLAPLTAKGKGAPGNRVVCFAPRLDRRPAASRRAVRGDHRDRSLEPGGRSGQEDRAALPLARRGNQANCDGFARPCREHVRGVQSTRERPRASARSPTSARRAIRIRTAPGTELWRTPSSPRRATRGSPRSNSHYLVRTARSVTISPSTDVSASIAARRSCARAAASIASARAPSAPWIAK